MYGDYATYGERIIGALEIPTPARHDAPGQRSWFHGDVAAPYSGELAAASWESMQREGLDVPRQRSWFHSQTATEHRGETAVEPRERSPREGLPAPGLTGWYHREETTARLREPHRWFPPTFATHSP